jgi:catechol 2,3-dioxygenase-like lactoylglutathione lyase family enzyme
VALIVNVIGGINEMNLDIRSIRAFIGAKDFNQSRLFYKEIGFEEVELSAGMSLFKKGSFGFYLQNYYTKDWIENLMLFIEVEDVDQCYADLLKLKLNEKYEGVKLVPIKVEEWGKECFLLDPAGVLLHFGQFNK